MPGEFWAIPLRTWGFACGVVLAVAREPTVDFVVNTRAFLAGLLDWEGSAPPTTESTTGATVAAQGFSHIRTITETGGEILGRLAVNGPEPRTWRSAPGRRPETVYRGIERLRQVTPEDRELPLISHWGYGYMRNVAETAAVRRRTVDQR